MAVLLIFGIAVEPAELVAAAGAVVLVGTAGTHSNTFAAADVVAAAEVADTAEVVDTAAAAECSPVSWQQP